jgi:hypothetical protein
MKSVLWISMNRLSVAIFLLLVVTPALPLAADDADAALATLQEVVPRENAVGA